LCQSAFAILVGVVKGVAVLSLLFAVACASPSTDAAVGRPALRLVDSAPITVRGTSFKAKELVRVTFVQGATRTTRTRRATLRGSFTTSAGEDSRLDRCGDLLLITAIGGRGSRASLKYPLPDCPPAP
jgi:hypothetical protein